MGAWRDLFLVSDEEERGSGLPDGEHDVPLVIQDRSFDSRNQLVYLSEHPMARMTGFLGDRIPLNGKPDFTLTVSSTAYRLRLLNGSNSRIFDLAWSDGRTLTVIGTDGGLLERPVQKEHVLLAPGERIELWADFSDNPVGYRTTPLSLPFNVGMMGSSAGFAVCKVRVTSRAEKKYSLPRRLSEIPSLTWNMKIWE